MEQFTAVVFMSMFFGASSFDKDVSSWDVSAVLYYMDSMFDDASSLSDCNTRRSSTPASTLRRARGPTRGARCVPAAASPPSPPAVCKPFCEDKTQAWDDNCTWGGCNGCSHRVLRTRRRPGMTSATGHRGTDRAVPAL